MLTARCEGAFVPRFGKLGLSALLAMVGSITSPWGANAQGGAQRTGSTFSSISRDDELRASSGDVRQRFTDVVARSSEITRRSLALQQRQQRIAEAMNRLQPPSCSAIDKLHWSGSYSCTEDNTQGSGGAAPVDDGSACGMSPQSRRSPCPSGGGFITYVRTYDCAARRWRGWEAATSACAGVCQPGLRSETRACPAPLVGEYTQITETTCAPDGTSSTATRFEPDPWSSACQMGCPAATEAVPHLVDRDYSGRVVPNSPPGQFSLSSAQVGEQRTFSGTCHMCDPRWDACLPLTSRHYYPAKNTWEVHFTCTQGGWTRAVDGCWAEDNSPTID